MDAQTHTHLTWDKLIWRTEQVFQGWILRFLGLKEKKNKQHLTGCKNILASKSAVTTWLDLETCSFVII